MPRPLQPSSAATGEASVPTGPAAFWRSPACWWRPIAAGLRRGGWRYAIRATPRDRATASSATAPGWSKRHRREIDAASGALRRSPMLRARQNGGPAVGRRFSQRDSEQIAGPTDLFGFDRMAKRKLLSPEVVDVAQRVARQQVDQGAQRVAGFHQRDRVVLNQDRRPVRPGQQASRAAQDRDFAPLDIDLHEFWKRRHRDAELVEGDAVGG